MICNSAWSDARCTYARTIHQVWWHATVTFTLHAFGWYVNLQQFEYMYHYEGRWWQLLHISRLFYDLSTWQIAESVCGKDQVCWIGSWNGTFTCRGIHVPPLVLRTSTLSALRFYCNSTKNTSASYFAHNLATQAINHSLRRIATHRGLLSNMQKPTIVQQRPKLRLFSRTTSSPLLVSKIKTSFWSLKLHTCIHTYVHACSSLLHELIWSLITTTLKPLKTQFLQRTFISRSRTRTRPGPSGAPVSTDTSAGRFLPFMCRHLNLDYSLV